MVFLVSQKTHHTLQNYTQITSKTHKSQYRLLCMTSNVFFFYRLNERTICIFYVSIIFGTCINQCVYMHANILITINHQNHQNRQKPQHLPVVSDGFNGSSRFMRVRNKNGLKNMIMRKLEKSCNEGTQRDKHDCSFAEERARKSKIRLYILLKTGVRVQYSLAMETE